MNKIWNLSQYFKRPYNWLFKASWWWWLPSEYQEVEYIQSSGTQLIDTWYLITPNTEVSVDYQFTNANSQDFVFWIGSDSNTSSWVTFCIYIWNTGWNYYFKVWISDGTNANTWENKLLLGDTNRHTFVVNNWHSEMYDSSGTLETSISTIETFTRTAGHSFWLFCWWRTDVNPARRENKTAAKLYWCTIKESWTLQRNFVPCYRKSDSVIWMYDLINNTFYTNEWTGTFAKWWDVN